MKNSLNLNNFFIILVEPKFTENLGSIFRSMKNFGFQNLILINPRVNINEKLFVSSVWAGDLFFKSIILNKFEDLKEICDILIATSARISKGRKRLRKFISLKSLDKIKYIYNTRTGIVFGREEYGLTNEEIKLCDILLHIPTSEDYPVLNLSHAVSLVCYEIFSYSVNIKDFNREALPNEKKVFVKFILDKLGIKNSDRKFLERILLRTPIYKKEINKAIELIKRNK